MRDARDAVKRKRKADADEDEPAPSGPLTVGQLTSGIGNKRVRSDKYHQLKRAQDKEKRAERTKRQKAYEEAEEQGLEPPPKAVPKTIENTREPDVTAVNPADEEVAADEEEDEFAEHFKNVRPPNVLITTSYKPSAIMYKFIGEMLETLPEATYYKRQGFPLKKIVQYASARGFTDLLVFNEARKAIDAALLVHLPDGPTAQFRLSNLVLGQDIKGHGRATTHKPELVLNNFGTRLGRRVGRMWASLFSQDPAFRGRRVVTLHNQRDYIFFRHHRYMFEERQQREKGAKDKKAVVRARLQELGPRFTLRLQSLQRGTFDSKAGEFEWVHKPEMDTSRRRFHL